MLAAQRTGQQTPQQTISPQDLAKKSQEFEDLARQQKWPEAARKYFELPEKERSDLIKRLMDKYRPLADRLEQLPDTNAGQRYDTHFGTIAHKVIAAEYVKLHPGQDVVTNSQHVKTMAARLLKNPKLADNGADKVKTPPDITNLTTKELYEIKPKEYASQGRVQRDGYIAAFKSYGVNIHPGSPTAAGVNGMKGSEGGFVVYQCVEPGLILYERREKRAPATAPAVVPLPAPQKEETPLGKAVVLTMLAFFAWLISLPTRFTPSLKGIPMFTPPTLQTADVGEKDESADT